MLILNKKLISLFLNKSDYKIVILNGYIKEASVRITYANGACYEIRVSHVPDKLKIYGGSDEVGFYVRENKNFGFKYNKVPKELSEVVNKLKNLVLYTEEEITYFKNIMDLKIKN